MRTKFKHFIFISIMFLFSLLLLPGYQAEAASAKIKLDKTSVILYTKGEKTVKLKATVTGSSKKVKWSSGNKKVATVSASGKVTAKKAGKTVITAKIGKSTAKCKVTVKRPPKTLKEILAACAGIFLYVPRNEHAPMAEPLTLHADGTVSGNVGTYVKRKLTGRKTVVKMADGRLAGSGTVILQYNGNEEFLLFPVGVRPRNLDGSYYTGSYRKDVPNLYYVRFGGGVEDYWYVGKSK